MKTQKDYCKSHLLSKQLPGWTLTEILIVLAIIGILVLLVLPNQTAVISKAKAKEAQLQLNALYTMELSYFYERSKYSNSFEEIGFVKEKLTTPLKLFYMTMRVMAGLQLL